MMLNDLDYIIMVVFLGAGVAWLYNAWRLRKEPRLFDSKVLYPGNCTPKNCKDPDGFRAFMLPRSILMGVFFLLVGAGVLLKLLFTFPLALSIVLLVLAAAVFGWCFWCYWRAARLFW